MADKSLRAAGVGVSFSGLSALSNVSLEVQPGHVVGLIGPNGAGKTTMVNVLTGFQAPTSGTVTLDGATLNGLSAHEFRRRGIARTFQAGRLFRELSVLDNLAVVPAAMGKRRAMAYQDAFSMLESLGLTELAWKTSGALPYTDERRVAIARALMCEPQFVLLDEPAAGMSDHEAHDLAALIRSVALNRGCGVLLIEHNVRMVLDTCSHIVVLDSGSVIDSGPPSHIQHSDVVRHAYMGTVAEVAESMEAALG